MCATAKQWVDELDVFGGSGDTISAITHGSSEVVRRDKGILHT